MYEGNAVGAGYLANQNAQRLDAPSDTRSPIRDGISHSEQVLSELHEAISHLEKRLDTVLTPSPPQPAVQQGGGNARPSGPAASHVHGRLVILNEGYFGAVQRLREIAQRIEV